MGVTYSIEDPEKFVRWLIEEYSREEVEECIETLQVKEVAMLAPLVFEHASRNGYLDAAVLSANNTFVRLATGGLATRLLPAFGKLVSVVRNARSVVQLRGILTQMVFNAKHPDATWEDVVAASAALVNGEDKIKCRVAFVEALACVKEPSILDKVALAIVEYPWP